MKKIIVILIILLLATPSYLSADILFSQDFDDDTTGAYLDAEWTADWDTAATRVVTTQARDDCSIVDGAEAYSGKSLKVTYKDGEWGGGSGASWQIQVDDYEELYISYRMKLDSDFDFIKGGKLPGIACINPLTENGCPSGGNPADGTNGCSARSSFKSDASDGALYSYVYHTDQPTQYGETMFWDDGPGGSIDGEDVKGEWHHVEIYIKINTVDEYDGILRVWWDGVLVGERTNYRWRTVDTFEVDDLFFSTFFGGGDSSYAPIEDEYAWFDDVFISTHKLGPEGVGNQSVNLSTGTESFSTLDGGDKTITW